MCASQCARIVRAKRRRTWACAEPVDFELEIYVESKFRASLRQSIITSLKAVVVSVKECRWIPDLRCRFKGGD